MTDRAAAGRKARRRGYRAELQTKKVFERAGARVARFAKSQGIPIGAGDYHFGDLLVIFPNQIAIVEVKTDFLSGKEMDELVEELALAELPPGLVCLLAVYKDNLVEHIMLRRQ